MDNVTMEKPTAAEISCNEKVGAGDTARPAYRGKYPERIKSVCSALRKEGDRYAPLIIETNAGAKFVHRPLLSNKAAPMPKVGQEIEFWMYHVDAMDDEARCLSYKYGIESS